MTRGDEYLNRLTLEECIRRVIVLRNDRRENINDY